MCRDRTVFDHVRHRAYGINCHVRTVDNRARVPS
jgi:hypothetical protein